VQDPAAPEQANNAVLLARALHVELGGRVDVDEMYSRAESAGVDPQEVDEEFYKLREQAAVKVVRRRFPADKVLDVKAVDAIRQRVRGLSYWVTSDERSKYGADEMFLVPEPGNEFDSQAVAVFSRGRKIGYLTSARAAMVFPLLVELPGIALRVRGEGRSGSSSALWVYVPETEPLRRHIRAVMKQSL